MFYRIKYTKCTYDVTGYGLCERRIKHFGIRYARSTIIVPQIFLTFNNKNIINKEYRYYNIYTNITYILYVKYYP